MVAGTALAAIVWSRGAFAANQSPLGPAEVFAGSGAPGITDGASRSATFLEPIGIAHDGARRTTIVADAGAQRIRAIASNGSVKTLAGSGAITSFGIAVSGGYRDGPSALAKFDRPEAVAVDRDGSIVVADTRNHCLRRIRNGNVTTIAGSPARPGALNGPAASATFLLPRSLAFASDGSLYIADWGNGVRRLDVRGNVTSVPIPTQLGNRIVALSLADVSGGQQLFVSNGLETYAVDSSGTGTQFWSSDPNDKNAAGIPGAIEGGTGTGQIIALSAIGQDEFLYTSADANDARYVHRRFGAPFQADLQPVGGLDSPTGIARLPDGSVLVADSGHRRIVRLPGPDRRDAFEAGSLPAPRTPGRYRIAYLSNSFIHYDVWWDDSISAKVESRLDRDASRLGMPGSVELYPVRFGPFSGLRDYVENVLADGLTDAVVIQLNAGFQYTSGEVPFWSNLADERERWQPALERDLRSIAVALRASNVPLVVVVQPVQSAIGPLERIGGFELEGAGPDSGSLEDSTGALVAAVQALRLPCVRSMESAFVADERRTPRVPLFRRNGDIHLSPMGNDLVATELTNELESCQPWQGRR